MVEEPSAGGTTNALQPNIAALLCYLLMLFTCGLPVAGIVFLVIEKQDRFVLFHAWQSVTFGVAWWVLSVMLSVMGGVADSIVPFFGSIFTLARYALSVGGLVLWVLCMIRAYNNELWRIPMLGDFAAKQAGHE
jgi:uncharacterized membrane protein